MAREHPSGGLSDGPHHALPPFVPEFTWVALADAQADITLSRRWVPEFTWGSPASADTVPPSVSFAPAAGSIAPGDLVQVRTSDPGQSIATPPGVSTVTVYVQHGDDLELVAVARAVDGTLDSVDYNDPYSGAGDVQPFGGNGYSVDVLRAGGWPWSSFTVRVTVVDRAGNVTSGSAAYTVSPAPAAPTFDFTPDDGGSFDYDTATPVRVDVLDDDGVAAVRILVLGSTRAELVFDDAPGQPAEAGYSVSQSAITGGRRFDVERVGGWLEDFTLVVEATDATGLSSSDSADYTLDSYPSPGDAVPPTTSNVQPPPGTPISPTTPVSVDVTDDSGAFRRVLVAVELDGLTEVAWDGDTWLGHYAGGGSVRDPIAGGFRFTVLRDGGWPSSPTLRVFAFDLGGNEV